MNPNVERLGGAFMVVSQGAATLVLGDGGVEVGLLRFVAAVVFLVLGAAVLAKRDIARGGAVASAAAAFGWSAYTGYIGGAEAVLYEIPVLALVGAVLAYHSATREGVDS